MNHERMEAVCAAIEADGGAHFSMRAWMDMRCNKGIFPAITTADMMEIIERHAFKCNTTGCFAGWAVALHGEPEDRGDIEDAAIRLLDLSTAEANHLFLFTGSAGHTLESVPTDVVVAEARRMVEADRAGRPVLPPEGS